MKSFLLLGPFKFPPNLCRHGGNNLERKVPISAQNSVEKKALLADMTYI
jgi:hypothetical protein